MAVSGLSFLFVAAGLQFLVTSLPMKLEGSSWDSIEKCAEQQKYLYQSIETIGEKMKNCRGRISKFTVRRRGIAGNVRLLNQVMNFIWKTMEIQAPMSLTISSTGIPQR